MCLDPLRDEGFFIQFINIKVSLSNMGFFQEAEPSILTS